MLHNVEAPVLEIKLTSGLALAMYKKPCQNDEKIDNVAHRYRSLMVYELSELRHMRTGH